MTVRSVAFSGILAVPMIRGMDPREIFDRTTTGDRIAVVGALGLIVSLFLAWYSLDASNPAFGLDPLMAGIIENASRITAFKALEFLDWVFLGVGIAVVVGVVAMALDRIDGSPRRLIESVGSLTALAIVFRMVDRPGSRAITDLEIGIWVALAGAVLISVGGMMNRRAGL